MIHQIRVVGVRVRSREAYGYIDGYEVTIPFAAGRGVSRLRGRTDFISDAHIVRYELTVGTIVMVDSERKKSNNGRGPVHYFVKAFAPIGIWNSADNGQKATGQSQQETPRKRVKHDDIVLPPTPEGECKPKKRVVNRTVFTDTCTHTFRIMLGRFGNARRIAIGKLSALREMVSAGKLELTSPHYVEVQTDPNVWEICHINPLVPSQVAEPVVAD